MTSIVLGLDGAGFELLNNWLGEPLENIQKIKQEGISADLRPCYPPVTCPNWQCYAKSMNPGKLGVFWWEHIDTESTDIQNSSSATEFDGEFFWDYLQNPRAVLNLPTSYPPTETNGVHVAGGPGAEQTNYTSPAEFETHLSNDYGYKVHPDNLSLLKKSDPYNDCIQEIQELIDTRFDVLTNLIKSGDYEFIHMSIFYINMLQHFYYDHEVVRKTWKVIDDRIGELIESSEIDNLFLMSDHGSNRVETWFRINSWLEQEGYLVRERGVSDWLDTIGLTRERVRSVLGTLGIEWWARQLTPERIQRRLPDSEGTVDRSAKADLIDWDQSQAIASGQGPLYILADDPTEREKISKELRKKLPQIRSPSGNTVCPDVWRAEDVYDGPHVETGPDLVVEQAPGVHIDGGIGAEGVFADSYKWSGENSMKGIFMAIGDDITDEFSANRIKITDLGPTILHLHEQLIPEHMDGTVLTEIFDSNSDIAHRNPEKSGDLQPSIHDTRTERSDSKVSERLEDLGYLE